MSGYALTSNPDTAVTSAVLRPKHICGEALTPVKATPGRFTCGRCLQTGYLLKP